MHTVRRSGKRSGFIQTLAARLLSLHFFRSRFIILLNTALRSCFVCVPFFYMDIMPNFNALKLS
nr:MAG TPA: hypothetical protein [Bacteriophage sp.]